MEIIINMKGRQLTLKKDGNIYEVFYKGHNIGWFSESYLTQAVKGIERNQFFDGKNYEFRTSEIDRKEVNKNDI